MSNLAKLKKKAAEFELKKQFDRALAVYVEILDKYDDGSEDVDVALFNRVGDLLLRQGNVADAVDYYERAIDKYADGGFFNNAIALCNKVLRHSPGRASVYYKLGKISAQKGFKTDAKKNFLEYADRMQQSGNINEAFRALKEFADLCPDQDDIRLMLADQLSRQNRPAEALEQLEILYARYQGEGRQGEAKATLDRMKNIDPDFEPQATGSLRSQASQDLVFLDLSEDTAPQRTSGAHSAVAPPSRRSTPVSVPPTLPPEPEPIAGMERTQDLELAEPTPGAALEGLEPTTFEAGGASDTTGMAGLEPTTFDGADSAAAGAASALTPPAGIPGLEPTNLDLDTGFADASADLPLIDDGVVAPAEETPVLDFILPATVDEPPAETPARTEGGSLDFMSLDDEPPSRRSSAEMLAEMESPLTRGTGEPANIGDLEIESSARWDAGAPQAELGPAQEPSAEEVDLPLMDLEVPQPRPTVDEQTLRKSREIPELTISEDLDAIIEAAAAEEDEPAVPEVLPIERTRRSTMMAAQSVEMLRAMVESEEDPALRRKLGEAMLDSGDREGGMRELEQAMIAFEQAGDLNMAASVADEIGRVAPEAVRIHQKRVEFAFRINDQDRLCAAYLDLADALRDSGQDDKARTVYQRVLELQPDELRAQAAIEALAPPADAAPAPAEPRATRPTPTTGEDFINLGDLLREDEGPKTTRFTVDEHQPSGDEDADFADMLRKFKQGVAENVEDEDYQSHYDLGVAFREMGLIDEAIAEFQKALRAPTNRLPTYEALGQCFVEKEQYAVASAILSRALTDANYTDEQLIGVLYLLGRAAEGTGARDKALEFYQRVFMVDIQFQDVAERLAAVEQVKA